MEPKKGEYRLILTEGTDVLFNIEIVPSRITALFKIIKTFFAKDTEKP